MQANAMASVNQTLNTKSVFAADIAFLTVNRNSLLAKKSSAQNRSANVDFVTISNDPAIITQQTQNQEKTNPSTRQGSTSHVIEEYNAKGELLLIFVDHKNNVIYQM
jgi:hypothetical protein